MFQQCIANIYHYKCLQTILRIDFTRTLNVSVVAPTLKTEQLLQALVSSAL